MRPGVGPRGEARGGAKGVEARRQKKPLNMYLLTFGSLVARPFIRKKKKKKERPGNLPKFKLLTLLP